MATKNIRGRRIQEPTKNERYLSAVFSIIKKRDAIAVAGKNNHYNDTELRLIGEVLAARSQGERLISTEIAKRLGVTRSAISQIVTRLEGQGIIKRVPDDKDRKIAYVELTKNAMTEYEKDMASCADFIGRVVTRFGEEKFERMCDMVSEFVDLVREEKKEN